MFSRRLFCLSVVSTLGGCPTKPQPLPDDPPPIETKYLPEKNVVQLWHAGTSALTEIEELLLRIQPHSDDAGEDDPPTYGALLDHPDGTTYRRVWISTEDPGIVEYPLKPGEKIYGTGYEKSGQEHELESGDQLDLVAYYPNEHGVVHFRGYAEVP